MFYLKSRLSPQQSQTAVEAVTPDVQWCKSEETRGLFWFVPRTSQ